MPNWCMNKLDVTGRDIDLEEFRIATSNKDGEFSFAALVPFPKEDDESSEVLDWRSWTNTNWGTKWDIPADECTFSKYEDDILPTMTWEFSSAWAPPLPWLYQVSEKFPHLDFKLWFDEPGMSYSGCAVLRKGSVDKAESWESSNCFIMGPCAVKSCEEYVHVDAFERHAINRTEEEHYYCAEHRLYELVEAAYAEDSTS